MIYTKNTRKAMQVAYNAHNGQFDKSGVPYIFHPYFVAELVSNVMPEEVPVCVALLHDVDDAKLFDTMHYENAKSIMNIIGACIKCGMEIEIKCNGEQEEEAMQTVKELVESGFGE